MQLRAKDKSVNANQWDKKVFNNCFMSNQEKAAERIPAGREAVRDLIGADEVIFIKRIPYTSSHYYTEYLDTHALVKRSSDR